MIQMVNWLLTRRCNLHCEYCGIVRDYLEKPKEYPDMKYYRDNEMSTEFVIESLNRIQLHNPNSFHIFYGGEPFLRDDLSDIINHCNKKGIFYTVISNNSPGIRDRIKKVFNKVSVIEGFSASVDPEYEHEYVDKDEIKKSFYGLEKLKNVTKDIVKDPVAEITVQNHNIHNLHRLVKELSDNGIYSSITFIDIAKNPYYDFSNVYNPKYLVERSEELADQMNMIYNNNLLVHMGKELFDITWDILPSNLDCELEKGIHNICIDADGSVRLCLRIRGVETPKLLVTDYINTDGTLDPRLLKNITEDKKNYCELCNHTCMIMSKIVDYGILDSDDIIHTKLRGGNN